MPCLREMVCVESGCGRHGLSILYGETVEGDRERSIWKMNCAGNGKAKDERHKERTDCTISLSA